MPEDYVRERKYDKLKQFTKRIGTALYVLYRSSARPRSLRRPSSLYAVPAEMHLFLVVGRGDLERLPTHALLSLPRTNRRLPSSSPHFLGGAIFAGWGVPIAKLPRGTGTGTRRTFVISTSWTGISTSARCVLRPLWVLLVSGLPRLESQTRDIVYFRFTPSSRTLV